jgi:hypothetical protein
MTTALTLVQRQLTPSVWDMISSIAPAMHRSRLFGVASSEQAQAIMLAGYELGLPLAASFDLIHVISNKPSLSPRGALAIIHGSPVIAQVKINRLEGDKGAFVGYETYIKRQNGFEFTARFTLEDAKRAGLIKPDSGWAKYPENMCLWRSVGFAADVVCPDVTAGMKFADQYGADLTPEGDVIEGSWTTPPPVANGNAPEWQADLQWLLDQFGAETVLQANDGKIPATAEEVTAVRSQLVKEDVAELNGELFGDPVS